MEGVLLIPPDRGTIIGRALWKARFVVVGNPQRDAAQANLSLAQVLTTSRIKDARVQSVKSRQQPAPPPDAVYLSIYKSRDDFEPVQQHSMASITSCSVQLIAHRKQGPVLPTLIIQISPDPTTDKLRKRRSSRTAGLTTTKESGPTTLWFRPGDETYSLQDWARQISSLTQPSIPDRMPLSPMSPMSPTTPVSPTFINPFAARSREAPEYSQQPSSGRRDNVRPPMSHKQSNNNSYSSRDRAVTFSSESPSLRSRTSDLSSHTSSTNAMGKSFLVHGQHYTTVLPTDLPSPASTVGEYQGECMLGWTSAQGRSSALSSPIRGRGSVSSQGQQAGIDSSSPPAPRETILDRAFQMRCIPGSERESIPGEEKLSSIARFEALMRETEVRRKHDRHDMGLMSPMTSTWEEDEDSEEDDLNDAVDEDDDTDDDAFEQDVSGQKTEIGPSAQRALHYITNRHSAVAPGNRNSLSFHADSRPLEMASSALRPHTAHSKTRPALSARATDQTQYPISPMELAPTSSGRIFEDTTTTTRHHEDHQTSSSGKRLSFNEFTKRLSSTSSLLLVQSNVSAGSSRGSSDVELSQQTTPRNALHLRSPPRPPQDAERCGWRGSVGVFGAGEGGFL